jgi:hypothetical protein
MKLTPQAEKQWESIPKNIRMKLLNNVFCVACSGETGIAEIEGKVEKGDLVLRGKCIKCGHAVARVIEND